MKKSISSLLDKYPRQGATETPAEPKEGMIEILISEEELQAIRGGDEEYKPVYDEPQKNLWQKAYMLFDFGK